MSNDNDVPMTPSNGLSGSESPLVAATPHMHNINVNNDNNDNLSNNDIMTTPLINYNNNNNHNNNNNNNNGNNNMNDEPATPTDHYMDNNHNNYDGDDNNNYNINHFDSSNIEIWGTDIRISQVKENFISFINNFRLNNTDNNYDNDDSFYLKEIDRQLLLQSYILTIDATHLHSYSQSLYNQLINYPQELIPTFDECLNNKYNDNPNHDQEEHRSIIAQRYSQLNYNNDLGYLDDDVDQYRFQCRIYNLQANNNLRMRSLEPQHIDTLMNIKGE